ncbi:MAG: iron-sulfur cluster carrier protein ApbC [Candidatus Symbiodolus clandestinus]
MKLINPSLLQQIEYYLSNFEHPTLQRSLGELEALQHCEWRQKTLQIVLKLPFVWRRGLQDLQQVSQSSWKISSVDEPINWRLLTFVATLKPANGQPLIPNIRNLIAVHSAKGGVGKSSIAVNLALALAAEGGRVGLFDADIYGPSIPTMLGTLGQKPHIQQQHMQPIEAHGIVMNSIGYLLTDRQAPLWRGPMASRAVEQLLRETLWPELDYLVIDMPPGTGDIPLTLAQKLPITAVIGITTPQQVAISDTQRGFHLWRHLNIPVLGIVENMSHYYCPHCNQQEMIFGSGGGQKLAEGYQVPLLGQLPLQPLVQQHLDQGIPTVIAQPQSPLADWFYHLADQVAALLYWQGEPVGDMINIRMCD